METERRILKSTTILFSASLIAQLANFVFVVYLARAYDPVVLGEYAFALSLGALLGIFVSLGTNRLLLRKWAEDPGGWQAEVGLLLPAHIVLATLLGVVIFAGGWAAGLPRAHLHIIAVVSSLQLMTPVWGLLVVGFSASERMGYGALADMGIRLSIMLFGSAAIGAGAPPQVALLVLPLSGLLALGALFHLAATEFGMPSFRLDIKALRSLWREAAMFFLIGAVSIVYARSGLLLLRGVGGAEQVGIFAPAERLVTAAGILHVTFASAIYPPLIRFAKGDTARFQVLADRATRLMILLSLPIATVLFLFAEDLVLILFGDEYRRAVDVLRIVAWLFAFKGIGGVLERIAIAGDRRRLILLAKGAGLVCLLGLGAWLAPGQGAVGLAVALVASQTVKLSVVIYGLVRAGVMPAMIRPGLNVLVACAVTAGVLLPLGTEPLAIRSVAALVLGCSMLWLLGAVQRHDLLFLRRVVRGDPRSRDPRHQS